MPLQVGLLLKNKEESLFEPQRLLVIPREHGAWFMLLLSLFVGAGAARSFGLPFVFLCLSAAALFSSLYSLGEGTKKASIAREMKMEALSSFIYFLLALVFIAPLFIIYRLWSLLSLGLLAAPFFGIYLYLILQRKHRTIWGELINIAGISFPAAASYYISSGVWTNTTSLLWLLTFLYSASSIFYVRLKIKQKAPFLASPGQRFLLGKSLLAYLLFLFVTLIILTITGLTPFILLVAYLPLALKSLFGIFYSRGTVSIKRVGFAEIGYSALFVALFLVTFHS